ncbi:hypothetical protein OAO18_00330 [Francisellaceae bacterium]|nr:hypothetical protein [Francisellaceae bacterium]
MKRIINLAMSVSVVVSSYGFSAITSGSLTVPPSISVSSDGSIIYNDGNPNDTNHGDTILVDKSAFGAAGVTQLSVDWDPYQGHQYPQMVVGLSDGAIIYFDGNLNDDSKVIRNYDFNSVGQMVVDWGSQSTYPNTDLPQVVAGFPNGEIDYYNGTESELEAYEILHQPGPDSGYLYDDSVTALNVHWYYPAKQKRPEILAAFYDFGKLMYYQTDQPGGWVHILGDGTESSPVYTKISANWDSPGEVPNFIAGANGPSGIISYYHNGKVDTADIANGVSGWASGWTVNWDQTGPQVVVGNVSGGATYCDLSSFFCQNIGIETQGDQIEYFSVDWAHQVAGKIPTAVIGLTHSGNVIYHEYGKAGTDTLFNGLSAPADLKVNWGESEKQDQIIATFQNGYRYLLDQPGETQLNSASDPISVMQWKS